MYEYLYNFLLSQLSISNEMGVAAIQHLKRWKFYMKVLMFNRSQTFMLCCVR